MNSGEFEGGNLTDRICGVGGAKGGVEEHARAGRYLGSRATDLTYRRVSSRIVIVPRHAMGGVEMQDFTASVQNRVLSVVRSVLAQNAIIVDVHPESRLVDIGLDSMDMVELMLKVEAEFDLTLPQPEITPENFQSVKTMELMILNQLGPGPG
jgi:acyl carrier protein